MSVPVITIANHKGGVAKTTTAVLLAEYLSLVKGLRVLAIDLDQGAMSYVFGVTETLKEEKKDPIRVPKKHPEYNPNDSDDVKNFSERSSILDIFYGLGILPYDTYIDGSLGAGGTVEICPSSAILWENINETWHKIPKNQRYYEFGQNEKFTLSSVIGHFRRFLEKNVFPDGRHDVVIVDSGPSTTPLLKSALYASTHVITPYTGEELSVDAIPHTRRLIMSANFKLPREHQIEFLGLLPSNIVSSNTTAKRYVDFAINEYPDIHFDNTSIMYNRSSISRRMSGEKLSPPSMFLTSTNTHHGKASKISKKDREMCFRVFDKIYMKVEGSFNNSDEQPKEVI